MRHSKVGPKIILAIIILGFSLVLYQTDQPGELVSEKAKVTKVIDGDTLETTLGTVRLLGVDAPEFDRCFYHESRDKLADLVAGQNISLTSDPLNQNTDEYGRLLRYVYLSDDANVGAELIRTGYARHLSWFPITQNEAFANLETHAKQDKLGLWQRCY